MIWSMSRLFSERVKRMLSGLEEVVEAEEEGFVVDIFDAGTRIKTKQMNDLRKSL